MFFSKCHLIYKETLFEIVLYKFIWVIVCSYWQVFLSKIVYGGNLDYYFVMFCFIEHRISVCLVKV